MRARVLMMSAGLMALSAMSHAQPLQSFEGALTSQAPEAGFEIALRAGQVVTLTTSSDDGLDTVLELRGPDGRPVATNDDVAPGDLSSRIVYAASADGRYTAVVSGFGGSTGVFDLQVEDGADLGLSDEARVLTQSVVSLAPERTEVRYPVDLADDDIFVASTLAISETIDTTLRILGPDGEIVAENDDIGDGTLNSQIIFQPEGPGQYVVVASTYDGATEGQFLISLATDPQAPVPFDFSSIARTPFDRREGELTAERTQIEIPLDLTAGQTIMVTADATSGDLDPVLRLAGPDTYPVALNDDRGDGTLNSAFAYTVPESGTYTLRLSRFAAGDSTGGYALELSTVDASVVDTLNGLLMEPVELSGPEQSIETRDFRLYYTLEGRDRTTEPFARETADAFQRLFDVQMQMGWAAPIRDPDGRYHVYLAHAEGAMGYMKPTLTVFDNPGTAGVREMAASRGFLVIDNNLGGMGREEPAEALMRATVTHEFAHLVQHGYESGEGLDWLYESTSSWIETVTVGEEEDAARYAADDFATPQLCWTTTEPGRDYGQWTLLQSLADTYGQRVVVRLWENTIPFDGMEVMSRTLSEAGGNVPDALRHWRFQNFALDYDVAHRMSRPVHMAGSIKNPGSWSAGDPVEQLGVNYVQVRTRGPHRYALGGADSLEMFGLGVRDGQLEVTPLGRDGVFDGAPYEYAALMVFNRAVPVAPGDCTPEPYSIEVSAASGPVAAVSERLDASRFVRP